MNNLEDMLKEFIEVFDASMDARLWMKLVEEERNELLFELDQLPIDKVKTLKEFADMLYVVQGFLLVLPKFISEKDEKLWIKILDEAYETTKKVDLMFEDGVIGEALRRVHESNMSKLGDDGKPILREDGKILKGPNYMPPTLDDLIEEKE